MTIKELRKAKAWSQAHLADVAGVSMRTIQRLERTGNCADETLLAIAAALDIDVQFLTARPNDLSPTIFRTPQNSTRTLWKEVSSKQVVRWGLPLLAPSLLFAMSNVLKFELGLPWLYDAVVAIGEFTGLSRFADVLTSPAVLLGGAFLAFVLSVMAQLRIRGEESEKGLTIKDLRLSFDWASSFILVASLVGLGMLIGYAAIENLAEWIIQIVNS